MNLSILAIGKMKSGPEADLFQHYVERSLRAGRQLGLNGPHVLEWSESRAREATKRKHEESQTLISNLQPDTLLVALDERGRHLTSREFSTLINNARDQSVPRMVFAIGGPDGHDEALLSRANHTICLGKMTWPHQLARILLAEQIYRSMTLISGHPYHRD